jgi:cyclophilin family peptidyl-prolyl cis-trans isomerase
MSRRAVVLVALVALLAGLSAGTLTAATGAAAKGCPKVPTPKPTTKHRSKPKQRLDPKKHWTATFETSCGSFTVSLAVKTSPNTTASFASLARTRFYDNTIFHRIVPGFVIQGGDPTQTSTGGPGYSVVDKPPKTLKYTPGTVAMAKSQMEEAGTSGSQYFVVTGDASFLPPDYALLGHVTKGMSIVTKIGKLGDSSEAPTLVVVVRHIAITGT